MANKPIQTSDIIQDKVLEKTIKEFEAWSKVVNKVESDLLDLAKVTKKGLFSIDTKQVEAVKELSNQLSNVESKTKLLNTSRQKEKQTLSEVEKLQLKLSELRKGELDEAIKLRAEINKENKARRESVKTIIEEEDAYKTLSKERTKAQNDYKRLAVELGNTSDEAQKALARFNELDVKFTEVNNAVKDGRPFVGRYADAIREAGLEGSNTTKILLDLRSEQEKLNDVLLKQRKEFGKNSDQVKATEKQLKKLNETIEEVEKSSKGTENAINKLTKAVKALVAATVLLKVFEFIADIFSSSDDGADGLQKTLARLTITIQVLVDRTVKSFDAFKNNFFVIINEIQLGWFNLVDAFNIPINFTNPFTGKEVEVFNGKVIDVTDNIKKLKAEQLELSKSNTDISDSFAGVTEEIENKIKANDKAIDQERSNIKQIAILERQSAKLAKSLELLALIYDDDSQALTDRSKTIKEAIDVQEELNKTTLKSAQLEVEATRLRAEASTNNAQAQADYIQAQARLIEIETQGLTELNGLRRENNSINRDIRDLELDILLDNVDNKKTINEREFADESLSQSKRKKLLEENVGLIEDSFKQQADVVNKELADLGKSSLDFNKLLTLSSKELADYLKANTGETQAIRVLEILKERRTALQDIKDTQKELNESDKEILRTNEDIILQEQALIDLKKEGADSEQILKDLEDDRFILKVQNLQDEIALLEKKNELDGGDSKELVEKRNELNNLLLKSEEERIAKEEELEQKRLDDFKELQNTITDLLQDALDKRYDKIQANLDRELEASETQQKRLQELADKGSKDALESLQLEREKEEAIKKEKLRVEKQQFQAQRLIAGYQVLAANDGNTINAIAQMRVFEELLNGLDSFAVGTESLSVNGSGVDGKGGVPIIAHRGEGIITEKVNAKKLKAGLTNETAIDNAIKYQNLAPQLKEKETVKEFNEWLEVKKAIQDLPNKMPIQNLIFDEQEKAYINIIKRNGKTERKHTRSNGLFR